ITTRLKRLDDGEYSALVLAVSGLQRVGLAHRITRIFTVDEVLPAPGQGILACQGRAGEDYGYLSCVDYAESRCCALGERSFSRALGGGCNVPVGAYGVVEGERLRLRGLYVEGNSGEFFRGEVCGLRREAESVGQRLAEVIMS
ncbi:MAG: hydroxymethylbilane synthase, partial [Synergistaceae bacterium]|nr:hydroxymethylbilane synthase [Synergistaceae bacterium]